MTFENDDVADVCGIEVFKVEGGRLAHCWNAPYGNGQVIFLDDHEGNVLAAEALGIRSLLVDGDGAKTVADLDAVFGLS